MVYTQSQCRVSRAVLESHILFFLLFCSSKEARWSEQVDARYSSTQ